MKIFRNVFLAIILGSICSYAYFALYGIIASFDVEHRFLKWITMLPEDFRSTGAMIHSQIIEFISAVPLVLVFGCLLGLLVKEKAHIYGVVLFIGFISFFTVYSTILWGNFTSFWDSCSGGFCLIKTVFWILLFILMTSLGVYIHTRHKNTVYNKSSI